MKTSQEGINAIKKREGLRLKSYQDQAGVWTIGYGHTSPMITEGMKITKATAENYLKSDVRRFEDAITEAVRVGLSQHRFDTLVSFAFNVGVSAFKGSTLVRELNRGNYENVPHQLMRWNKITVNGVKQVNKGLINRRSSEVSQWAGEAFYPANMANCKAECDSGRKFMPLMADSKTTQGGAVIAGGAGYSWFKDLFDKAGELQSSVMQVIPDANHVLLVVAAVGVFVMFRRWQDSRRGRAY